MTQTADIVVAGAGHNSLITAAYLAKAGYSVIVLDARPIPGGGASTEEPLLPGYLIDTCSTGHTLIRVNPLLTKDELGLHSKYGLKYVEPDPVAHVAFADGEYFTHWLDLDRTCEEIARFSKHDAQAYRRMMGEYDDVKAAYGAVRFTPPGLGPSLQELLLKTPHGQKWLRIEAMSSWDVIRHEFENRHIQAYMLWQAFQTVQAVDVPGSGSLAYSLIYSRQQRSWSVPVGGSGKLTEGLTMFLEEHGAQIICEKKVNRLVLENGRCTGVETEDGERYMGAKAVVSTIHVKHLIDMAPHDAWPEDFHYGVETYDIGITNMGVYIAAKEAPKFTTRGGTQSAVSAGLVGWPGLALGANLAETAATFEATHGSAPKYAGMNRINPMAMMLSGVMMLRHLNETYAANMLEGAIAETIREGRYVTYDMKADRNDPTAVGTSQVADAIIGKLEKARTPTAI